MKKRQAKKETASQGTRRKASVKLNRPKPLKASKAVKPKKKNSVRPKPVKRNVESLTESNGNKDELDYNIIGSSSKGNCVRIENIMVDIGMPFKYIKEDLYKTDIILITHIHSDHIKQSVFHRIREDFPDIKIVGNHEVACQYDLDFICNESTPFEMDGYTITPFKAVHNVLCYGYIWNAKGKDIIYCTDSSDFDNSSEDMK